MNQNAYHRRSILKDKLAAFCIKVVGLGTVIIASTMLLFIASEAWPIFESSSLEKGRDLSHLKKSKSSSVYAGSDEYGQEVYRVQKNGWISFFNAETSEVNEYKFEIPGEGEVRLLESASAGKMAAIRSDGTLSLFKVDFETIFKQDKRIMMPKVRVIFEEKNESYKNISQVVFRLDGEFEEETCIVGYVVGRAEIEGFFVKKSTNFLGEEEVVKVFLKIPKVEDFEFSSMTIDTAGRSMYAGTDQGYLFRWSIDEEGEVTFEEKIRLSEKGSVNTVEMLLGELAVVVGLSDGGLEIWCLTSEASTGRRLLRKLHHFDMGQSVAQTFGSSRNRMLGVLDDLGSLTFVYTTSGEKVFETNQLPPLRTAAFSPNGDRLMAISEEGEVLEVKLNNDHPEVGVKTLFSKVWYEGYDKPDYTWQSSGASDEFEPKLSLVPLVFGSFKGAVYAMLFSIPLALFSAIYISQFASLRLKTLVKPVIELMSGIPSVVIGFFAALWIAPLLDSHLITLAVFLTLLMPAFVLLCFAIPYIKPSDSEAKIGPELFLCFGFLIALIFLSDSAGEVINNHYFSGEFRDSFLNYLSGGYEQRNSVIIAFALGFTVIPIIFTIAEDSLSNLPKQLTFASLALGASPWQTVWRVLLPSASSGIFAGCIVGFGRAVGETMIVLMATGNTPILDWSVFNGMRTLAANIAVELPEAPVGSSLYRVLFLSAVLLFILTSILNTAADFIQQRLRKKYALSS